MQDNKTPQKCPICKKNKLVRYDEVPTQFDTRDVECRICCRYLCDGLLFDEGGVDIKEDESYLLSALIRESNLLGNSPLYISYPNIENLIIGREVNRLQEKSDKLLKYLEAQSKYFGDPVQIDYQHDYPIAFCRNGDELVYLMNYLDEMGLITDRDMSGNLILTPAGYQHIEDLALESDQSPMVFVAMWFNEELKEIYKKGFHPGIKTHGYDPKRIDFEQHNQKIDDLIISYIKESNFLVADFTGHRPSVYFEAGYALGLGKNVIWCCRDTDIDDCHFDTRQYNHIVWKDAEDLRERLALRIISTIGKMSKIGSS